MDEIIAYNICFINPTNTHFSGLLKKKLNSLREKYCREKQEMDMLCRSRAAATQRNQLPLMFFFYFMFDTMISRELVDFLFRIVHLNLNSIFMLPVLLFNTFLLL